jgi:RIO kinase 2
MVRNVASEMAELEPEDFFLLSGLEHGMRFARWVEVGKIAEFSRLDPSEVEYRLDRCEDRGFVERNTIQYQGFRLTFEGYDVLALRTFSERETLKGVGAPLGVGKESDVYEATSYKPLALKFHREGYTNFREVRKERDYTSEKQHISWFYTARKAAEREYETLEALYPDVRVPQPLDQNRHAVVMEKLPGVELSNARLVSAQVVGVLELVLDQVQLAHQEGFVHADLSEYNIFVDESGVTVFDWPQAVQTDHENAGELLERDLKNLLGYFTRKHPGQLPSLDAQTLAAQISAEEFDGIATVP